eukprot:gene13888-15336_t
MKTYSNGKLWSWDHLTPFTRVYPQKPPKMRFLHEFWHPNVSKDGDVCISILHEPGEDKFGYEKPEERWLPIHTVETILLSVISMISDPNDESPANVDAAKEWRSDYNGIFKKNVRRCVRYDNCMSFAIIAPGQKLLLDYCQMEVSGLGAWIGTRYSFVKGYSKSLSAQHSQELVKRVRLQKPLRKPDMLCNSRKVQTKSKMIF